MDSDRRKLLARWTVTATLHLESASQIGSHESDYGDQTFACDSEGRVTLQGSTLGGALRSALADRLKGYRQREMNAAEGLFGNEQRHESPFIVFDAVSREKAKPAMRDGVRIDTATGTAEDKGKYDREVALGGIAFDLRFDLLVDKPGGKRQGLTEEELLAHLVVALTALQDGRVRFGARKSRGLGVSRADAFRARRYDLTCPEGWRDYARSAGRLPDLLKEMASRPPQSEPAQAILQEWGFASKSGTGLQQQLKVVHKATAYKRLTLTLDTALDSTVIIRSPGIEAGTSDVRHLTEAGTPLLSGTSLAGSLRAEAIRILNTLQPTEPDSNLERIAELFGDAPKSGQPRASRLVITEAVVMDAHTYRQTRVKIDRFTGGVLNGALLEEEPVAGGRVKFTVEVLNPEEWQIGLALLAVRELAGGWRTVGGEAAVGRGLLRGDVTITLPDDRRFTMPSGGFPTEEAKQLQRYVDALWQEIRTTV